MSKVKEYAVEQIEIVLKQESGLTSLSKLCSKLPHLALTNNEQGAKAVEDLGFGVTFLAGQYIVGL